MSLLDDLVFEAASVAVEALKGRGLNLTYAEYDELALAARVVLRERWAHRYPEGLAKGTELRALRDQNAASRAARDRQVAEAERRGYEAGVRKMEAEVRRLHEEREAMAADLSMAGRETRSGIQRLYGASA